MATWSAVKTTAVAAGGFQQALTGMMTAAMHQKKVCTRKNQGGHATKVQ